DKAWAEDDGEDDGKHGNAAAQHDDLFPAPGATGPWRTSRAAEGSSGTVDRDCPGSAGGNGGGDRDSARRHGGSNRARSDSHGRQRGLSFGPGLENLVAVLAPHRLGNPLRGDPQHVLTVRAARLHDLGHRSTFRSGKDSLGACTIVSGWRTATLLG